MKTINDQIATTKDTQPAESQADEPMELTMEQLSQVGGARINLHPYP